MIHMFHRQFLLCAKKTPVSHVILRITEEDGLSCTKAPLVRGA